MLTRFLTLAFLATLVAGCSQATYDRASSYKLCKHYLTKPAYNVHYKGVVKAIEKRGIDCDPYLDRALADKAAEDAAAAAYNASSSSSSTSRQLDDLQDEMDQLKRDRAFGCIAAGGVMVGNTCM